MDSKEQAFGGGEVISYVDMLQRELWRENAQSPSFKKLQHQMEDYREDHAFKNLTSVDSRDHAHPPMVKPSSDDFQQPKVQKIEDPLPMQERYEAKIKDHHPPWRTRTQSDHSDEWRPKTFQPKEPGEKFDPSPQWQNLTLRSAAGAPEPPGELPGGLGLQLQPGSETSAFDQYPVTTGSSARQKWIRVEKDAPRAPGYEFGGISFSSSGPLGRKGQSRSLSSTKRQHGSLDSSTSPAMMPNIFMAKNINVIRGDRSGLPLRDISNQKIEPVQKSNIGRQYAGGIWYGGQGQAPIARKTVSLVSLEPTGKPLELKMEGHTQVVPGGQKTLGSPGHTQMIPTQKPMVSPGQRQLPPIIEKTAIRPDVQMPEIVTEEPNPLASWSEIAQKKKQIWQSKVGATSLQSSPQMVRKSRTTTNTTTATHHVTFQPQIHTEYQIEKREHQDEPIITKSEVSGPVMTQVDSALQKLDRQQPLVPTHKPRPMDPPARTVTPPTIVVRRPTHEVVNQYQPFVYSKEPPIEEQLRQLASDFKFYQPSEKLTPLWEVDFNQNGPPQPPPRLGESSKSYTEGTFLDKLGQEVQFKRQIYSITEPSRIFERVREHHLQNTDLAKQAAFSNTTKIETHRRQPF